MAVAVAPTITPAMRPYRPYGASEQLLYCREPEVVVSGPAGTGKSRGELEKLHLCAEKYAGMRGLICRKTRTSITQSAMVTFEQKVLPEGTPVKLHHEDQEYRYPNGSVIVVGGLDKPSKIMSTEFDIAYVQEATELEENDWESITTRLRNGVMPYQQLIGDCNPGPPTHWMKLRAQRGALLMIESVHEDNPVLFDHERGEWTPEGVRYIGTLDRLTGVRKLRLRHGIWAAAEGMVYEDAWSRALNVIDPFPIPKEWPRYWAVDFGFTNPFVWQAWAEDPDGRLYRYREIYMTHRLVADHGADILTVCGWQRTPRGLHPQREDADPLPLAIICDHDAEDRATLERAVGLPTLPAYKAVSPGIQATANRMKPAGDGRPRLVYLRDALVERDETLALKALPTCTEDEVEGYIWDIRAGKRKGEQVVKENDHGMDTTRYMVAFVDSLADFPFELDELVVQDDDYVVTIGPRY